MKYLTVTNVLSVYVDAVMVGFGDLKFFRFYFKRSANLFVKKIPKKYFLNFFFLPKNSFKI